MTRLVQPRNLVCSVKGRGSRPPPPADLNKWGERNIVITESPQPGPFRVATIPAVERILHCLGPEHPARTITIKASVQIFKTTVAMIFLAGSQDIDPCDTGYVLPTHDQAIRWSRTKWKKLRRSSPRLVELFGAVKDGKRDSTDTTLFQETKDGRGTIQISGANSEASLTMATWRRQVQDDLAKWESNEGGDSENQADGRSSAYDWAKILKISSPKLAKTCRITRAYKAGTQEKFHVPCPHAECGYYQPLEWPNFLAALDRDHPELAHFTCVSCGAEILHKDKRAICARGKWVAENPTAKDPSFYIWRAYSPFRDWESIGRQWIAVEGNLTNDEHGEQVFFNEVLGLEYEVASEAPPWEEIRNRAESEDGFEKGRIQPGALKICAGTDCQGDRTEVHIKGFGEHFRRWTIDYRIIEHHISTKECRDELDKIMSETWPDAFGNRRGIDVMAIDGNFDTNDVFGWVKERHHHWNRAIIVRGAKSDHAPVLALTRSERKADGKTRRTQRRFYNVGTSTVKSSLYEHLKKVDPLARGYCAYPRGMPNEFYMQLTAETRVVENDKWGFPRANWRKDRERNEVLDTEVYAEAAAYRCGFYTLTTEQWGALRAQIEKPNEDGQRELFDPGNAPSISPAARPKPAPFRDSEPLVASDPYL